MFRRLPLRVEQRRRREDLARRRRATPGTRAARARASRLRDRRASDRGGRARAPWCGTTTTSRPRVGGGEDRRERVVDRVGEDVGAGHQRDAERDRDAGQRPPAAGARRSPRTTTRAHQLERLHQVEHAVDVERRAVVDDAPVGEHHEPVGVRRGVRVVGHHHDGLTEFVDGAGAAARAPRREAAESRLPVGSSANTTAGREIERAGDRDALLLAARELRRAVVQAVADADGVDQAVEPLRVDLLAGDRQRQQDVLARVEDRQQVEGLEDEADLLAPQQRQRAVVERRRARRRRASTVPLVGRSSPASSVHERRLARARRAHDRREAAAREGDVDAGQRVDGDLALAVAAAQVGGGNDRFGMQGGLPVGIDAPVGDTSR